MKKVLINLSLQMHRFGNTGCRNFVDFLPCQCFADKTTILPRRYTRVKLLKFSYCKESCFLQSLVFGCGLV